MEEVRWRQQKQKNPMNPTPIPAQTSSSLIPNPFLPSFSSPYRHHATSTAQSYAATCSKIFQSLDHFDPLCIQEMLKKRKKRVCGRWNDAPRWSLSSIPPRKGERPRREARMVWKYSTVGGFVQMAERSVRKTGWFWMPGKKSRVGRLLVKWKTTRSEVPTRRRLPKSRRDLENLSWEKHQKTIHIEVNICEYIVYLS